MYTLCTLVRELSLSGKAVGAVQVSSGASCHCMLAERAALPLSSLSSFLGPAMVVGAEILVFASLPPFSVYST